MKRGGAGFGRAAGNIFTIGVLVYVVWYIFLNPFKTNSVKTESEKPGEAIGATLSDNRMSSIGDFDEVDRMRVIGVGERVSVDNDDDVIEFSQGEVGERHAMDEDIGQEKEKEKELVWVKEGLFVGRYSWYWPELGGINCQVPCAIMANGEEWKKRIGEVVACPGQFRLGSWIKVGEGIYECADRGGQIVLVEDGSYWIDFLEEFPRMEYGSLFVFEVGKYLPLP